MRRNMIYGLLVLFMLFLITANPSGTGSNGREFVTWLSQGWDDTRAFVSSLVGEEEGDITVDDGGDGVVPAATPTPVPVATPTPIPTPAPTATPDPASGSQLGTVE